MRPTRTTALVFAAVTLAATAASPSPAAAFFPIPIGLFLGQPHAMTFHRGPTESMGRGYMGRGYKAWTGTRSRDEEDSKPRTRSRDEDSKPSKSSTRTSSKDDDGKPSKSSTRTSSKDDDSKWSSKSGKGAKSAAKAEANANSGHGGRQTQRRWSVEHEATASKSSGRASTSVQRAGPSAGENSDTRGASVTGTQSNIGDFDENLGQARIDELVEQPPK